MSQSYQQSTDLIKTALSEGSVHGFGPLYKTKRILFQVIWIICIVLAIYQACYTVIVSLIQYYDFDVVSDISTFTNLMFEFPSVTICSQDLDIQIEDMLVECNLFDYINCNASYFTKLYYLTKNNSYPLHSCFSFNTSQRYIYLDSTSLDMTLYTGRNLKGEGGLHLIVHNSSHYVNYDEGFDIPSGNYFFY